MCIQQALNSLKRDVVISDARVLVILTKLVRLVVVKRLKNSSEDLRESRDEEEVEASEAREGCCWQHPNNIVLEDIMR